MIIYGLLRAFDSNLPYCSYLKRVQGDISYESNLVFYFVTSLYGVVHAQFSGSWQWLQAGIRKSFDQFFRQSQCKLPGRMFGQQQGSKQSTSEET